MKAHLFMLGFLFFLPISYAQTIVNQGKLDAAPTETNTSVVYVQGIATPMTEGSQSAAKQVVQLGPEPELQTVVLVGTAQAWEPNAGAAEKQIVTMGEEPVQTQYIQGSATLLEEDQE